MTDSTILELIQRIDDFSADCERREHTDTGEAWDLLHEIREELDAARRYDAGSKPVRVIAHIRGGVVSNVELPVGVTLEVCDYDVDGVEDERMHQDAAGRRHTRALWDNTAAEPSEGSES